MINPLQLTGQETPEQIATVYNDLVSQIVASDRTDVKKDENGNYFEANGRMPDGTYNLIIMKSGNNYQDVFTT